MIDFSRVTDEIMEKEEGAILLPLQKIDEESFGVVDLQEKAMRHEISCMESLSQALSMALQARKMLSSVESHKKESLKAYSEVKREIDDYAKTLSIPLKNIEKTLIESIESWAVENSREIFEDEAFSLKVPDGTMTLKDEIIFEIEDQSLIPESFLKVDMEAIETALKGGIKEIPGIKINTKKQVKLRVKNEK